MKSRFDPAGVWSVSSINKATRLQGLKNPQRRFELKIRGSSCVGEMASVFNNQSFSCKIHILFSELADPKIACSPLFSCHLPDSLQPGDLI